MKQKLIKRVGTLITLFILAVLPLRAATNTVLQLYANNILKITVEDGVWSNQEVFATKVSSALKGLASDGRRVFVGELGGASTAIREFDLEGNLIRTLAYVGESIEYMSISWDGKWVYTNLAPNYGGATTNAVVHRYNATTGEGGLFIPNTGTNELGEVLWKFQIHRGVTEDEFGNLWVSERSTGTLYKFNATDGSYLGKITSVGGIQGLYYHSADKKIYCTTSGSNTYIVDIINNTSLGKPITGTNTRLAITNIDGVFYSSDFTGGDVFAYDFENLTATTAYQFGITKACELITLPRTPLREKIGELLIAETVSNRVMRVAIDTGGGCSLEGRLFAGDNDVTYDNTPLRQPRGLAAYSNYVYVAEGVAGGRILKFSKWGTFKGVALDFSQSTYPGCVPAALAVTPDGQSLYVTDAHTIFIKGNGTTWSNVMTNGYLSVNSYGATVYKVNHGNHTASVFVNVNNLPVGNALIEPRGVAVDEYGNVYFTSWYNDPTKLYNANGGIYHYNSAGVMQAFVQIGNPSASYYDPIGNYHPPAGGISVGGPGIITAAYGNQDIFWTAAGGSMTSLVKLLDNNLAHTYLDVEVINGQLWYTDAARGSISRRSGDNANIVELTGLAAPTYMAFVEITGTEPPAEGTIMFIK
ncbi:MAG: hypothetical protein PHO37_16850 [Kiritimatiellae bacterium]|nr:hypothetical protein [Kiritimatiellia bacterium]